ncbi:hypothetical protein NEIMUCOT_04082 [Neisseria mucosa ATCC 25996]|uniref:Uncharacterized protein n=1 Tax=Neisseria mucosa (strain ATCC 25996 / DSM 4631 / NCTC 10774 / M26) TaxID=546266 RepID=D2ZTZ3_NEIM2|nr:hypothetical protein NEIMUCOT_04082 [Neisseria mucosa ATCC 25996]
MAVLLVLRCPLTGSVTQPVSAKGMANAATVKGFKNFIEISFQKIPLQHRWSSESGLMYFNDVSAGCKPFKTD